jgi:hypothetical protein
MVPEPDQLPANSLNGPVLEAEPTVAALCALAFGLMEHKIVKARAAQQDIALSRFMRRDII